MRTSAFFPFAIKRIQCRRLFFRDLIAQLLSPMTVSLPKTTVQKVADHPNRDRFFSRNARFVNFIN
jgi:hypothetical protein